MSNDPQGHRPIFIVGVDRSGTSLLSEIIVRWGAQAGRPEDLPVPDDGNPQGYWEYKPMQDFAIDLTESLGISIWDSKFASAIRAQAFEPYFRDRAIALASSMSEQGTPWLWKESTLIFILPFLLEVFPDARFLITLRDPTNSAVSYEKLILPQALRGRIRLVGYTYLRWQYLMTEIAKQLKSHPNKMIVAYELLVSSPRTECARICRFLDREYGLSNDSEARTERMVQTVDSKLWRNKTETSFLENSNVPAVQKQLFAYLSSHLDGDFTDFDETLFPFPEWAREYCANIGAMQWIFSNL